MENNEDIKEAKKELDEISQDDVLRSDAKIDFGHESVEMI